MGISDLDLLEQDKRDLVYARETLANLGKIISVYERYSKMKEMYPEKYKDAKTLFEKYQRLETWLALEVIYGNSPNELH